MKREDALERTGLKDFKGIIRFVRDGDIVVGIKDLPPEERPREKLLLNGPETLSDEELIAILIESGTQEKSALELAKDMMGKYKGFRGLAGREIKELTEIKGIQEAKAVRIAASFEIATRIVKEVMDNE